MIIKRGSRGDMVRSFQAFLIAQGCLPEGEDDGVCGARSVEGIKRYQRSRDLVADGVAGRGTLGQAKEDGWAYEEVASEAQVQAAEALGVPVKVVQAIERVESGGHASAVRFEPHVFLRKRPDLEGAIPFTRGPKGFSVVAGETDRDAFERAFTLDPEAAVASTSWGLYQVMGSHLLDIYGTPASAADSFYADPVAVSYKLFVKWFQASPRALAAARERDWRELAHRYNGPGNIDKYSVLLQQAYSSLA